MDSELFFEFEMDGYVRGQYELRKVITKEYDTAGRLMKNTMITQTDHVCVKTRENGLVCERYWEGGSLVYEYIYNENGLKIYEMYNNGCTKTIAIRGRHWGKEMSQDDDHFETPNTSKKDLTLVHRMIRIEDDYITSGENIYMQVFDRRNCVSKTVANPEKLADETMEPESEDHNYLKSIMGDEDDCRSATECRCGNGICFCALYHVRCRCETLKGCQCLCTCDKEECECLCRCVDECDCGCWCDYGAKCECEC
jgi:hypothetical protein